MYTHIHTYIYMYKYLYMFVCINIYVHVCTHAHMYICVYEYTYIYMYTYIYTHIQQEVEIKRCTLYTSHCYFCSAAILLTLLALLKKKQRSCQIQAGEDAKDALNCRSLLAKEPIIIRLFCRKRSMKRTHLSSPPCR